MSLLSSLSFHCDWLHGWHFLQLFWGTTHCPGSVLVVYWQCGFGLVFGYDSRPADELSSAFDDRKPWRVYCQIVFTEQTSSLLCCGARHFSFGRFIVKPIDLRNIVTFGVVGILATIAHVAVAIALIEIRFLQPFSANAIGFGAGFLVSYFGHHRFSFESGADHRQAMPRFLTIAGFGLFLNQAIVYVMVNLAELSYFFVLVVIIATVPPLTYLSSRRWAFAT